MIPWVVAGLVALVVLVVLARRHFRANARRRLVLGLKAAGVEVLEEDPAYLLLRGPHGEGPLFLDRFYPAAARHEDTVDPDAHLDAVVAHWVAMVQEFGGSDSKPTLEKDGARILPRLATEAFLRDLPPEAAIPYTPLGETGLIVVYVLDLERSVAYLTADTLRDLGLDRSAAHALALENLAGRTPPELARALGERAPGVTLVKTGDTYDAARLLLVPLHLGEGEARLAAVPDRDSLAVLPDDALQAARDLARAPGGERPLFDRPLRVTRAGVTLAA